MNAVRVVAYSLLCLTLAWLGVLLYYWWKVESIAAEYDGSFLYY